jgi:tRNA threonylcarbamoyladenosine biosynthesis protein TsaB
MKLYIDSTDNKKTIIRLGETEFVNEVASPRDQNILLFLQQSMAKLGLTPKDLTSIEVNPGPGSFTGSRLGVTIANALGYSLKIPINGQNNQVEVIYPNKTYY